jgi:hypothetical protein
MQGDNIGGGYPTNSRSGTGKEPINEMGRFNSWPAKDPNESEQEYLTRLESEEKGHVLTLQDISDIENSRSSTEKSDKQSGRGARKGEKEEVFQAGGVTTLTLRNIPAMYTEEGMLMELYQVLPKTNIDFFYMPWNSQENKHCGYAVVNFTSPFATMQCIQCLSGKQFSIIKSSNTCNVEPTELQGMSANLEYYKSKINEEDGEHGPKVFKNGKQMDAVEIKGMLAEHWNDSRVPSLSEVSKHSVSTKGGSNDTGIFDPDDNDDAYSESGASSKTGSEMSGSQSGSEGSSSCDSLSTVEPTVLSNFAARFG